jgi:integrase/recombinase XerD
MTIPAVKLITLDRSAIAPLDLAANTKRSPQLQPSPADLRWSRVEEFLRSRELRPNTLKAYERELRAFLDWTAKSWQDITARDLDRYKGYLKEQPSKRGGKRSAATINLSLSALQLNLQEPPVHPKGSGERNAILFYSGVSCCSIY